jgi:acetyl-CoA acyltransferase
MQRNVVIAGFARSPFHFANKGELATVRPDEMTAQVVRGLLEKTGVDPAEIEDLILGCAFPEGEQGLNLARLVGFLAKLPLSVAGQTINRFCGSSDAGDPQRRRCNPARTPARPSSAPAWKA